MLPHDLYHATQTALLCLTKNLRRNFIISRASRFAVSPGILYIAAMRIILASASPRRRDLLKSHGIEVSIQPSHAEELHPEHLTGLEMTLLNATRKAHSVQNGFPRAIIVAADTLVVHDGQVLGKPATMEAAFAMLQKLSGSTHQVHTGVCILKHHATHVFVETSNVTFRHLTNREIRKYHAMIGPLDKAGAYAAQENVMDVIQSVDGSMSNVIGLPMERLVPALNALR